MTTSDASRRHLRDRARLSARRYREDEGLFLVEGVRSVESAVAASARLVELIVTEAALGEPRVAELAEAAGVPVLTASERDFDRLPDTRSHQGLVAVAELAWAEPDTLDGPVIVLDGVQDPGNVGTVIRAAAWFGARSVLAGPGTADLFSPKVVRASMGGLWDVALASTDDLAASLDALRERGLSVHAADLDGEPVAAWSPPREAVLVLGSEAHGVSTAVQDRLDGRVRIGGGRAGQGVESLNVAMAASILLHRWLG